ncbi:MAG: hypothetical protein KIS96_08955 [Bauldia sp.]|nr:hypothetical protein [Bauldia sp.]
MNFIPKFQLAEGEPSNDDEVDFPRPQEVQELVQTLLREFAEDYRELLAKTDN